MPLWAKVDVEMPVDPKLLGQPIATRHLWTCLICLAKRQDERGEIRGYDCALLSGAFNIPRKAVASALTHYQAAKMVELDPDGTIRLLNFIKRQGEVSAADQREQWRGRQDRRRAVTRDTGDRSRVTDAANDVGCHANVTRLEVEEEKEVEEKATASQGVKPPAPTAAVWDSYSKAFQRRYEVAPIRNATVNGQLAHFITRMPAVDAPGVAEFYLSQGSAFYLGAGHSVKVMVRDAEKLHAGWSGGRTTSTSTEARQRDQTQANANVFSRLLKENSNA